MPEAIALKIKYLGKTPRTFQLPIPFVSKSARTGQVTCDPVGEFPVSDGNALLALPGADEMFKLVDHIYDEKENNEQEEEIETEVPRKRFGKKPRFLKTKDELNDM